MRVWRLCKKAHAAFDGEGALLTGGRWNRRGTAVVYASETLSLAGLELLVHVEAALAPEDLIAIPAEILDSIASTRIDPSDLPRAWRRSPAPESLARIGTDWATAGRTAVLSVPSALIPRERNVLLNPAHPDFAKIRIGAAEPFSFDPRLMR